MTWQARLRSLLGERFQENVPLAPFTSARIGGPADYLLTLVSADELAQAVTLLWEQAIPFRMLGGGSNVLVSDAGVRGVVLLNRARAVRFQPESVWAESGASLSLIARRAASQGLAGLEWAAAIPGTLGGAVYGNAGAFGGDIAGCLRWAELLTPQGRVRLAAKELAYGYRSSALKRGEQTGVVLAAELQLHPADRQTVQARLDKWTVQRKAAQPPGASMGSMFKNPPGDYAGRLIEAAGLKGLRVGNVEVSPIHANFFVNHGQTRAADVRALIEMVRQTVQEKFGVQLELEIELLGEW